MFFNFICVEAFNIDKNEKSKRNKIVIVALIICLPFESVRKLFNIWLDIKTAHT